MRYNRVCNNEQVYYADGGSGTENPIALLIDVKEFPEFPKSSLSTMSYLRLLHMPWFFQLKSLYIYFINIGAWPSLSMINILDSWSYQFYGVSAVPSLHCDKEL